MNEVDFLCCFSLITTAHNCQMHMGDEMVEVEGTIDQRAKCNTALKEILGFYLFSDIPETVMGWPV